MMIRNPFWRYFWLNTRFMLLFILIMTAGFSAFWSYTDGRVNLTPMWLLVFAVLAAFVGSFFRYRRYKRYNPSNNA